MIIYGKKNLNKLMNYLLIPNISVKSIQYWILPIYKVEIKYNK